MANVAVAAINTFLKRGNAASPEVFSTVAQVRSIVGPGISGNVVDITTHSAADPWRTKIVTLLDAGDVSFDISFIPTEASHSSTTGLLADFKARTLRNWQLVFPDSVSTTWLFSGYVTKFSNSEPVDGVLLASIVITITGEPTFAG
jgi:predicted secreted protein